MTACAPPCSAVWTTLPSGSSCCWPGSPASPPPPPPAGPRNPAAPVPPLGCGLRAPLVGRPGRPARGVHLAPAGVHALRPSDVRVLMLDDTDPGAGTLFAGGRARPLDQLTAQHLRA